MLYYRVKPQADQLPKNPWKPGDILISGELLTEKEYRELPVMRECERRNMPLLRSYRDAFDLISVDERETYWLFGARFADQPPPAVVAGAF